MDQVIRPRTQGGCKYDQFVAVRQITGQIFTADAKAAAVNPALPRKRQRKYGRQMARLADLAQLGQTVLHQRKHRFALLSLAAHIPEDLPPVHLALVHRQPPFSSQSEARRHRISDRFSRILAATSGLFME